MAPSNTIQILLLKALLFSAAIASVAVAVELALPLLLDFAVYDIPAVWSTLHSCFEPPYLYLLINIIIIMISATSRFNQHDDQQNQSHPSTNFLQVPNQQSLGILDGVSGFFEDPRAPIERVEMVPTSNLDVVGVENEENIVTSRFAQPKPIETVPDGTDRAEKENNLTDGGHVPITKHLQKSVTFENQRYTDVKSKKKKAVKKSATLKDRTNYDDKSHRPPSQPLSPASGGKLSAHGSPSHDELNRRIEEFIKKFNDEMRMQRQESVRQYRVMTNCGSHRESNN